MKQSFLIFALFVLPLFGRAETDANSVKYSEFWAGYLALQASSAKSFEDLIEKMPLTKKDKDLALKAAGKTFTNPEISLADDVVTLKFDSKAVTIDFKSFAEKKLILNGKEIALERFKTFLNYRSEVEMHLNGEKTKSAFIFDLFISKANAARVRSSQEIAAYVAVLFSQSSQLAQSLEEENAPRKNLDQWIIQGYVKSLKLKQIQNSKRDGSASSTDTEFSCKEGKLDYFSSDEITLKKTDLGWQLKGYLRLGSGWSNPTPLEELDLLLDGEFKITKKNRYSSLKKGANIFDQDSRLSVFRGIRHFQKCCEKKGCFENVSRALEFADQSYLSDPSGSRSAQ